MSSAQATPPVQGAKLPTRTVVAYSFGDVANNLSFQMTSMFLLMYMTNVAGISAAMAGTIYGVTKIWAGFTDLFAGTVVDRPRTRWGTLRPWLMWVSPAIAIVFVLLFSNPLGLTGTEIVAWVLLFDAAFQLCYSFINIPYGSLAAAMTQDGVDRSRLAGARSIASSATGVALSWVVAPVFNEYKTVDLQAPANAVLLDEARMKFTIILSVLALLAVVAYFICFRNTRELVPRGISKVSIKATLSMVGSNKPLLILCAAAFFLLFAQFTFNAVAMYYASYVLGDASWFTLLALAQAIGTIIIASFVPAITAKVGKRAGYMGIAAVAVLSYVVIYLVPAQVPSTSTTSSLVVALIGWFLVGVGSGGTNALMFAMQADTVDYGEWRTGTRSEGGSYSILSFLRKCGQGLGGFLGAAVIGAYGYGQQGRSPVADAEIIQGIRVATGLVPATVGVVAVFIMFFYPLTADQHKRLVTDLVVRRTRTVAAQTGTEAVLKAEPGVSAKPIVTLFEAYGAGASYIGPRVAQRLGVPWLGQRLSSTELEEAGRVATAGETTAASSWLQSFGLGGTSDAVDAGGALGQLDHEMALDNTRGVLEFAQDGGVLLGRNATVILADAPSALHVRLVAPLDTRLHRAAEQDYISLETAARRQLREDHVRVAMAERLMGWDPTDDANYDLVINTGMYSLDEAVDVIVRAYRSKYQT